MCSCLTYELTILKQRLACSNSVKNGLETSWTCLRSRLDSLSSPAPARAIVIRSASQASYEFDRSKTDSCVLAWPMRKNGLLPAWTLKKERLVCSSPAAEWSAWRHYPVFKDLHSSKYCLCTSLSLWTYFFLDLQKIRRQIMNQWEITEAHWCQPSFTFFLVITRIFPVLTIVFLL